MQKSDRIKAQVSLRRLVEDVAGVTWDKTKTRPAAGDFWAPCPLHGEKSSSFHVVEKGGKGGFFKCFGCGAGGTAIDFLVGLHGLTPAEAIRQLVQSEGLADLDPARLEKLKEDRAKREKEAEEDSARRAAEGLDRARALWASSAAAPGTMVAEYLAARGVNLAAVGGVPPTLRFAPSLPHFTEGPDGRRMTDYHGPAMVGAIGRDRLAGVHRTWISANGRARYADGRKVAKSWIGKTGDLMGRPCVLSRPTSAVVLGEGIETTLAGWSGLTASGRLGWSAEAALSRGAITGPATDPAQLWTPRPGVSEVLILGEGSSRRPQEARELYEGAAARLRNLGLQVALRVPFGRWDLDLDFADVALADLLGTGLSDLQK